VTIVEGDYLLGIDVSDERPNYYMSLSNAIIETQLFAKHRCTKGGHRAEKFGQLRPGVMGLTAQEDYYNRFWPFPLTTYVPTEGTYLEQEIRLLPPDFSRLRLDEED